MGATGGPSHAGVNCCVYKQQQKPGSVGRSALQAGKGQPGRTQHPPGAETGEGPQPRRQDRMKLISGDPYRQVSASQRPLQQQRRRVERQGPQRDRQSSGGEPGRRSLPLLPVSQQAKRNASSRQATQTPHSSPSPPLRRQPPTASSSSAQASPMDEKCLLAAQGVCGLVVEYLVAIEVTRVRFPANASAALRVYFLLCVDQLSLSDFSYVPSLTAGMMSLFLTSNFCVDSSRSPGDFSQANSAFGKDSRDTVSLCGLVVEYLVAIEARWQRVCGLVVEYLVAIEVTRVRFPADAVFMLKFTVCCVFKYCLSGRAVQLDLFHLGNTAGRYAAGNASAVSLRGVDTRVGGALGWHHQHRRRRRHTRSGKDGPTSLGLAFSGGDKRGCVSSPSPASDEDGRQSLHGLPPPLFCRCQSLPAACAVFPRQKSAVSDPAPFKGSSSSSACRRTPIPASPPRGCASRGVAKEAAAEGKKGFYPARPEQRSLNVYLQAMADTKRGHAVNCEFYGKPQLLRRFALQAALALRPPPPPVSGRRGSSA
ncbi:hypothetical protein Efla_004990 [Eimeria flavescens]